MLAVMTGTSISKLVPVKLHDDTETGNTLDFGEGQYTMKTALEDQITETWYINHRVNMLILDSLTEEALDLTTSKRGGGKVGHQLAHMYNVRFWKLEAIDKSLVKGLHAVKAADKKDRKMLANLHTLSADLIAKVMEDAFRREGEVKRFKRGVIPMLGYFISHEGHHRGNILLTLKQCGFKLPDSLRYGIWEWNKL
jgi:uncharacterized damage-inducible protein DinB